MPILNCWAFSCKKEIKVKRLCPDFPTLLCSMKVAVQEKKKKITNRDSKTGEEKPSGKQRGEMK